MRIILIFWCCISIRNWKFFVVYIHSYSFISKRTESLSGYESHFKKILYNSLLYIVELLSFQWWYSCKLYFNAMHAIEKCERTTTMKCYMSAAFRGRSMLLIHYNHVKFMCVIQYIIKCYYHLVHDNI